MPAVVAVALLAGVSALPSPATAGEAAPAAPHRVLLALVRWTGNPADATTTADAQAVLDRVGTWVAAVSEGARSIDGDARGWTTISAPSSGCATDSIRAKALDGLAAAGVDLDAYDDVAVYFGPPVGDACSYYGISGRPLLMAGKSGVTMSQLAGLLTHELGHNWDLRHATSIQCTDGAGTPVAVSDRCTSIEQGDSYDTMGSAGRFGSFNAAYLDALGWLAPADLVAERPSPGTTTTRSVTLAALADPASTRPRAIRVTMPDGTEWWIENRGAVGVDQRLIERDLPGGAGIQVRRRLPTWNGSGPTQLLDLHPGGSPSHADAALGPGGTWTSPDGWLTVTEGPAAPGTDRPVTVRMALPDVPYRPFASWDSLVAWQLYELEGRSTGSSERAPFVAELSAGTVTPATFIGGRIEGPWFGGTLAPVARLYWAYFRRTPDAGGTTYWAERRRAGTPLDTVSQSFASSPEFRTLYGSLTNRAFVQLVYSNVLGRPGDAAGIDYWTAQLDQRRRNRGQVMTGFSESPEHRARRAGDVTTFLVVFGMLRRSPTAAELAASRSVPMATQVEQVRLGAEYAARVSG